MIGAGILPRFLRDTWAEWMAAALGAAVLAICCVAPTEASMGHAQRIVYVHVPVAWLSLLGFLVMAACGVGYLARRALPWDHGLQAAAECGWLTASLTLATGSLWAHDAWGTWWVWEPRLTAVFILWTLYAAILLVRSGIEDPHRRARVGAVLAILGTLDLPLVVLATRWFRGMHPATPEMEPSMLGTLLVATAAFSLFFIWVAWVRFGQVQLEAVVCRLRRLREGESELPSLPLAEKGIP